eukprot:CAMPEP_0119191414 /NCGR_PEP_ID=MMETSP1316-20130426/2217_1 /TAXON_ID=41880 /ORGANISM="Pycnococcus provasolii, Strain RCC2336" /LENGTH=202 /DNA_ID=CAMNT_0007186437 /DNA_START=157 /DNA_END=765 /DNA_ORIENTATION=+
MVSFSSSSSSMSSRSSSAAPSGSASSSSSSQRSSRSRSSGPSTRDILVMSLGVSGVVFLYKKRNSLMKWFEGKMGKSGAGSSSSGASAGGRSAFAFPKGDASAGTASPQGVVPAPATQRMAGGRRVNNKKSAASKKARATAREAKRAEQERKADEETKAAKATKEERELNKKINNMADWEKTFTTKSEYKMDARLGRPERQP